MDTSVSYGKMETLIPCKIVTLEQIDTHNLSGWIMSMRGILVHLTRGPSGQTCENELSCDFPLFIYLFPLETTQRTDHGTDFDA